MFYAMCTRNHRVIIGHVGILYLTKVAKLYKSLDRVPIISRNLISFNHISYVLRYVYEKPPHNNRKCGHTVPNPDVLWRPSTCATVFRIPSSIWATFPIFYGICMQEHTCEAKLPHIKGNVVAIGAVPFVTVLLCY